MVLTPSWGRSPRTSASCRHEVSRGLDAGATRCPISESVNPSSEESAKEGLSWGASAPVTRSELANMGPRIGPAPHPPWSCTVSVREGSLGWNILAQAPQPAVCQCIRAECSLWTGTKATGNEKSLGTPQVDLCKSEMSPNQLDRPGMESPLSGERSS